MDLTVTRGCEWAGYIDETFTFGDFPAGSTVLDVGFGTGEQMRRLLVRGCRTIGLDLDPSLVTAGRGSGLTVCRAAAEALPFQTASFDGVICKVVVPYTDESRAIAEIARVLRPGGTARVSYHGVGYFLKYLATERNWKRRVYGARVLANTGWYAMTGRRFTGFWGDTLYQSNRRLHSYYAAAGFDVVEERPAPRFAGAPVFIYHVLRRKPASGRASQSFAAFHN
jgi:SAM-dependent methyltransferase